jgi:hypothetical protein
MSKRIIGLTTVLLLALLLPAAPMEAAPPFQARTSTQSFRIPIQYQTHPAHFASAASPQAQIWQWRRLTDTTASSS